MKTDTGHEKNYGYNSIFQHTIDCLLYLVSCIPLGSIFLNPLNHNKNKVFCRSHHNLVLLVSDPYEAEFVLGVQFAHCGMGHFYEFLILHGVELCGGDVHI